MANSGGCREYVDWRVGVRKHELDKRGVRLWVATSHFTSLAASRSPGLRTLAAFQLGCPLRWARLFTSFQSVNIRVVYRGKLAHLAQG